MNADQIAEIRPAFRENTGERNFSLDETNERREGMDMKNVETILRETLTEFGCQTGTLHRAEGDWLYLVTQIGVPEVLLDKISKIPFGKGIAGAAAQKREAVELCNLQQDLGGVAKEDARKTGVSGSLAVPLFSEDGQDVVGTLGIGKIEPYDFPEAEIERLAEIGRLIVPLL